MATLAIFYRHTISSYLDDSIVHITNLWTTDPYGQKPVSVPVGNATDARVGSFRTPRTADTSCRRSSLCRLSNEHSQTVNDHQPGITSGAGARRAGPGAGALDLARQNAAFERRPAEEIDGVSMPETAMDEHGKPCGKGARCPG